MIRAANPARRRKPRYLAATAVLVIGGFVFLTRMTQDVQDSVHRHVASLTPIRSTATLRGRSVGPLVGAEDSTLSSSAPAATLDLTGTVVIEASVRTSTGRVPDTYWLAARGAGGTLGRVRATGGGPSRVSIECGPAVENLDVEVDVHANGYVKATRIERLRVGQIHKLEFLLDPGLTLEGVVCTPTGDPVGDLPLLVTGAKSGAHSRTGTILDHTDHLLSAKGSAFFESRTRTDAAGRFRVSGLRPGPCTVVTPDTTLYLESPRPRPRSGDAEVHLTAHRALHLQVRVTDRTTGRQVPAFHARAVLHTPDGAECTFGLTGRGGVGELVWMSVRSGIEFAEGCRLDVQVQPSVDWSGADGSVTMRPGHPHAQLALEVEPRASGWVMARVCDSQDRPVSLKLTLEATSLDDSGDRVLHLAREADLRDGVVRMRCPEGRWQIQVNPSRSIKRKLTSWRGDVVVAADAETTVFATLPPFGQILLRYPESKIPTVLKMRGEGGMFVTMLTGTDLLLEAVPPGSWRYEVSRGEHVWRGDVDVRAHGRLDLTLD